MSDFLSYPITFAFRYTTYHSFFALIKKAESDNVCEIFSVS